MIVHREFNQQIGYLEMDNKMSGNVKFGINSNGSKKSETVSTFTSRKQEDEVVYMLLGPDPGHRLSDADPRRPTFGR